LTSLFGSRRRLSAVFPSGFAAVLSLGGMRRIIVAILRIEKDYNAVG